MEPPSKKQKKVLWDDDSSDEDGGVSLNVDKDGEFKINEDYAKRFEYNKKREELARCMYRAVQSVMAGLLTHLDSGTKARQIFPFQKERHHRNK